MIVQTVVYNSDEDLFLSCGACGAGGYCWVFCFQFVNRKNLIAFFFPFQGRRSNGTFEAMSLNFIFQFTKKGIIDIMVFLKTNTFTVIS